MKTARITARFLPLLDVTLILLGMLMFALMLTQPRSDAKQESAPTDAVAEAANVDFVYLYAGWEGNKNGRCFLLTASGEIGREVRTDTADDIQEILKARADQSEKKNQVVMLLFSDDGWFSDWTAEKLTAIEKEWGVRLVRVHNVKLLP